MTNKNAVELELETLKKDWADCRTERDVETSIRLANLATFAMFLIADGK